MKSIDENRNSRTGKDCPTDIGNAMLKLQSHIHNIGSGANYGKMNNAYFTQANIVAKQIVGTWLLHPKGRGWNLISDIDYFIKRWPAHDILSNEHKEDI